jgi:hypothetical protein
MKLHYSNRWLLIGLMLFGTAALAQDQGRVFHWSGKLAADKIVEIKNVNGNIEAETAGGDQIEVTAEKSGPRADEVKIVVVPHDEGVTICAIFPAGFLGGSASCEPGNNGHSSNTHGDDTRVRFTVRLPKNLRFSGGTVNGNVTTENMGRFVHAQSVNGSIHVSTAAWAQAETVNGSIQARIGDAAWTGTLKFASVNGSVELRMPDDSSADVKFSSVNGSMNSDFPLTISNGFPVGHSAHGTIGKGGRALVVDTVNGNVSLKKGGGSI